MSSVKKASICSFCIAICYVLPLVFHALGLGSAFSPMHLPILLCGLICGRPYGLFCGIAGPVLASLLSGMPTAIQLIYFIPELCVYGLASGILYGLIHTKNIYADIYLSLLPAMLLGRIVGGIAHMLFYLSTARSYSIALWISGYFAGTLPGVIVQLILIPALVLILQRARLIPDRYPYERTAEQ